MALPPLIDEVALAAVAELAAGFVSLYFSTNLCNKTMKISLDNSVMYVHILK